MLLHYTEDTKTPYCGKHLAYPNETFLLSQKLTLDLAEELSVDLCDKCLYIKWRIENHSDILSNMDKCAVGITVYPGDEDIYLACDLPELLHKNIPEGEQIHWDFSMGYWLGHDADTVVSL